MYKPKLEKEIRCSLEYSMDVFGGKRKPRIICVLADESPIRCGKLREETVNITDYVLTYTLKELTEDGLVERTQYNEIPPRVEYSLTEKGYSVLPVLQAICSWAGAYHKEEKDYPLLKCQKCDYRK